MRLSDEEIRRAPLYGLRTMGEAQAEPPKLRDLVSRAVELGYPMPAIEFGDGRPDGSEVNVPMVQVQLHSNEHRRRNVVAHCRIGHGPDPQAQARLAARSALAEALLLAEQPEALAA